MSLLTFSNLISRIAIFLTILSSSLSKNFLMATILPLSLFLHFITIPQLPSPTNPRFSYFSILIQNQQEFFLLQKSKYKVNNIEYINFLHPPSKLILPHLFSILEQSRGRWLSCADSQFLIVFDSKLWLQNIHTHYKIDSANVIEGTNFKFNLLNAMLMKFDIF